MYVKIALDQLDLRPTRRWRKGNITIDFGTVAGTDQWYVHRSTWPKAAVFPAVLERDACDFHWAHVRKGGWAEVPIGQLDSING